MSSTADAKQGPFSCGTRHGDLPTELRRIAEEELGETDSGREEALEKLTQLLQNEPDLDARTDPEFLLRFLRVRKYNVDAALNTIKNYYKGRVALGSSFKGLTPASVNPDAKELFIVMPERDRHGRLIILMRLGAWMPEVVPYCDFQQTGMMCLDHVASDPSSQTAGVTLMADFEGFTASKMLSCGVGLMRRGLDYLQNCLPIRLKAQHIVRESYVFDLLYALLRPFIKKKMTSRIHCHGYNFETLHEQIDPRALPEEFGGQGKPHDFDAFWKRLHDKEHIFAENNRYGYRTPSSELVLNDEYDEENTDL
ncbi:alpha-tocopherol transfer protein-like [Ixodes scapularis]|uniref:alpha-tocopherol transfer protein-like n=1 Tax=Ixodes scapularis TaxID=6945 RepID=UPI001A9DCB03|nr:alpha-tocopherol transfer protein-like [Ixodes scapularis]